MMLYYLDTNIVIYAVQAGAPEHQRAVDHLAALELAGHRFVISELTRTETLVIPFQPGNGQLLQDFFRFFHGPNLRTVGLTAAMHIRASCIRGGHRYPAIPPALPKRYGLADSLHLAAAIESGCDVFLTNDDQLANFPDITVEELP
jgi:predicted nucleic acid-binding protein